MAQDAINEVNLLLSRGFNHITRNSDVCFLLPDGSFLKLSYHILDDEELIIAEYADNFYDYANGRFEDGDIFYLSDYTPEEIAKKLIEYET